MKNQVNKNEREEKNQRRNKNMVHMEMIQVEEEC